MNTIPANLLNRMQAAIEAKTRDTLSDLAALEHQLADAVQAAEQAAAERIEQEANRVAGTFESNLQALQQHIDRMAYASIDRVMDRLTASVNAVAESWTTSTQPATSTPTPEPTYIPTREELEAEGDSWRDELEENSLEAEPIRIVAAHAVSTAPVGVLPEDDTDQDDAETIITPEADEMGTTDSSEGLYTRTGEGKRTRYIPAECPSHSEVYHRREGRRWTQVRYVTT